MVTPESATSPMDAANTLQIPRSLVAAVDNGDPEATMVVPAPGGRHQRLDDEGPAIAQEALTQSLQAPNPPSRPRHGRTPTGEPQTTPLHRGGYPAPTPPAPAPPPEPEQIDGLIPTVKQPPNQQSSLSRRLDG